MKQNTNTCECNGTGWVLTDSGCYKQCECVELEKANRLWQNFGCNPNDVKRLNEYQGYNDKTKMAKAEAVNYIKNFKEISNTRENSFGVFGQSGAGKTHIALAVGRALIEQKIAVVYMPYLECMRELKANVLDDEYYNALATRYQRAKVLIIDDLFKDKVKKDKVSGKMKLSSELTEADMKHIYPILNYRYLNKLPMIVSSECTPEMLMDLDEALAGRILESCNNYGIVFDKDCNYRLRNFKSK